MRNSMLRLVLTVVALGAFAAQASAQARGQRPAQGQQRPAVNAENVSLVYEREVFTYRGVSRRDPFRPLTSSEATGYGLGWRIQAPDPDTASPRVVHHGGSSMGARSMLILMPDDGIVVSILTNSDDYRTKEQDAGKIAGFFLEARPSD